MNPSCNFNNSARMFTVIELYFSMLCVEESLGRALNQTPDSRYVSGPIKRMEGLGTFKSYDKHTMTCMHAWMYYITTIKVELLFR